MVNNDAIAGVAIGISYVGNFGIEHQFGTIAEELLYNEESFFNSQSFPFVDSNVRYKVLKQSNQDNANRLSIANDQLVLDMLFDKKELTLERIIDVYRKEIIEGICIKYGIKRILRIGLDVKYLFENKKIKTQNHVKKFSKAGIPKRFQMEYVEYCQTNKKYVERISTKINEPEGIDAAIFSIDFQFNFEPFLKSVEELDFQVFLDRVKEVNEKFIEDHINPII